MSERLVWICLAGALGTGVRYLVGLWAAGRFGSAFPYGTLLVNLAGCFLMGLVLELGLRVSGIPEALRLALTTGFVGGLTTYSSFAFETTALARGGSTAVALANFGVTTLGCFAAVLVGSAVARALV